MHSHQYSPDDHLHFNRREWLRTSGLGLAGASLLQPETAAAPVVRQRARAKAVIFIFQSRGPSQHEPFDPNPDALDVIRGAYGTTQPRLPGVRFCEYLPR